MNSLIKETLFFENMDTIANKKKREKKFDKSINKIYSYINDFENLTDKFSIYSKKVIFHNLKKSLSLKRLDEEYICKLINDFIFNGDFFGSHFQFQFYKKIIPQIYNATIYDPKEYELYMKKFNILYNKENEIYNQTLKLLEFVYNNFNFNNIEMPKNIKKLIVKVISFEKDKFQFYQPYVNKINEFNNELRIVRERNL